MNMKKTMAAIAAGAVAVSAMATSVSAIQDTTLTYNLVENVKKGKVNTATLTAALTGAKASTEDITFALNGTDKIKTVTVRVTPDDTSEDGGVKNYTYSTDQGSANFAGSILSNTKLDISNNTAKLNGTATIMVTVVIETSQDGMNSANGVYGGKDIIGTSDTGVSTTVTTVASYDGASDDYWKVPFKTASSGNVNIIQYLQNGAHDGHLNGTDKNYMNVAAVLNDAIANYEGVTFKFNTAKEDILWYTNGLGNGLIHDWDGSFGYAATVPGYVAVYASSTGEGWSADASYKSFADHLYNNTKDAYYSSLLGNYAGEGTGYTGFDWAGYNLFQGALVINENLTMSLSDTEFFDWTETSISFDWDAIYSNAMTSNNYATYVQSLKLATSTTWYWDSMEVILTAGAAEDASSGAGAAGDEGTLDDDDNDDGDIALDDDDDDGDVVVDTNDDDDDDDADADTNDTQAPAQTASNPQTGNASVALAVIPVALAAAAIVAKKRG